VPLSDSCQLGGLRGTIKNVLIRYEWQLSTDKYSYCNEIFTLLAVLLCICHYIIGMLHIDMDTKIPSFELTNLRDGILMPLLLN